MLAGPFLCLRTCASGPLGGRQLPLRRGLPLAFPRETAILGARSGAKARDEVVETRSRDREEFGEVLSVGFGD